MYELGVFKYRVEIIIIVINHGTLLKKRSWKAHRDHQHMQLMASTDKRDGFKVAKANSQIATDNQIEINSKMSRIYPSGKSFNSIP